MLREIEELERKMLDQMNELEEDMMNQSLIREDTEGMKDDTDKIVDDEIKDDS